MRKLLVVLGVFGMLAVAVPAQASGDVVNFQQSLVTKTKVLTGQFVNTDNYVHVWGFFISGNGPLKVTLTGPDNSQVTFASDQNDVVDYVNPMAPNGTYSFVAYVDSGSVHDVNMNGG